MIRREILCVALLAAATLLLETTLTRLLAVAQFYHFAFLVVSLALLGFGVSGTLLSVMPRLRTLPLARLFSYLGLGFTLSVGLAYSVINLLPFDSYSIAWDRRQLILFALYYLALTLPFVISGLAIGTALAVNRQESHLIYAANLIGSSVGALLATGILWLTGVPGAVLTSGILGLAVAMLAWRGTKWLQRILTVVILGTVIILMGLAQLNFQFRSPLGMTISPYKGLAQVRRFPGARVIFSRWNAISRLDLVTDSGTHQLPGLSYLYPDLPPPQNGLSLDADAVQPVTLIHPGDFDAAAYLPEALVFELMSWAEVLILEPAGGLGVLQALAGGARKVTVVLENALISQAVAQTTPFFNVYDHPQVHTVNETTRVYLAKEKAHFEIVYLPLTDAYRPVSSGAYSLAEDYSLTVEAFESALSRLDPQGVLILTRWMQVPPSESLRAIATLVEALECQQGASPKDTLVAYRGIQTLTVLARPAGWTPEMLAAVRAFTQARKFDLVWLPDIQEQEVNRYNRLPEPSYYLAVRELLSVHQREDFYQTYPYEIRPPIDDRPFFFHFFTWAQTPEVLATLGHTWQPFGGSGYLVLLALLGLTLLFSLILILMPLIRHRREQSNDQFGRWQVLFYFTLLGIAFLFVEIPLIQRWILLLGHPTYAFSVVVATLLFFSGLGSSIARAAWLPRRAAFVLLGMLALMTPLGMIQVSQLVLSWPAWARFGGAIFSLAPLGILMGLPFPLGLAWLEKRAPQWIPWAWAVNGCASVIASVLAATLSLSHGFSFVLYLGAGAYLVAASLYYAHPRYPKKRGRLYPKNGADSTQKTGHAVVRGELWT